MMISKTNQYRLCIGGCENKTATMVLDHCVSAIGKVSNDHSLIALALTGSFSRGEGSILVDRSGVAHVLGDIEFFVALDEGANHSIAQVQLSALSSAVEQELQEQQIDCKVEFSPVSRNYFRRVRPSIFNYELLKHGKVVFGDKGILHEIPSFGAESIPPEDGFYLLCNRIVEQLIAWRSLEINSCDNRYQILKLYLDMAGSCLVVSGRYAPTYAERTGLCAEAVAAENIIIAADRRQSFLEILKTATAYKLNPNTAECPLMSGPYSPELFRKLFTEAASICRDIWGWELRYLFGASDRSEPWTVSANRFFRARFVVREWLKFLLMARRAGQDYSVRHAVRLFTKGTPRTLIYAAAVEMYFYLAEGQKVDLRAIEQLLPIPCRLDSEEQALDAVIAAWNNYVRSA